MKNISKPTKTGVLLVNLGSPDAPTPKALRKYLAQFLHDYRVIDINRWLWCPILHGIVLNTRPGKVAKAYASIWEQGHPMENPDGSPSTEAPLIRITRAQAAKVQEKLGDDCIVDIAMRYGSPSIKGQLDALVKAGCKKIKVFPLYPQFAGATTATIYDEVANWMKKQKWVPPIEFVGEYYDDPSYIQALKDSVEAQLNTLDWTPEVILTSFHGLPIRYCKNGDPYYCHCHKTARLLAEALNMPFTADESLEPPKDAKNGKQPYVQVCFQSQFGPEKWLKPATDDTLEKLAEHGIKKVVILCPGFSADCLETLEEIAMEGKEEFMEAGGTHYTYIPCLNADDEHINLLAKQVKM